MVRAIFLRIKIRPSPQPSPGVPGEGARRQSAVCRSRAAGFSLIELLVATTLSAVLMGAVLMVLAGLSRDRRWIDNAVTQPHMQSTMNCIQWDLANARTMNQSPDGQSLILIGNAGIDSQSLAWTGRLTRVIYRIIPSGKTSMLVREQEYLDDPIRPEHWRELLSVGVKSVQAIPVGGDSAAPEDGPASGNVAELSGGAVDRVKVLRVASRMRVHLETASGPVDAELIVK
jgi:prepilin-type N-terminal cleavage/methylation domain-containing protein